MSDTPYAPDELADRLLSDDERSEVAHIQKHFASATEEERGRLGWRATSIYLAAFHREIERLRRHAAHLGASHAFHDCACGHDELGHREAVTCDPCQTGGPALLSTTHTDITH